MIMGETSWCPLFLLKQEKWLLPFRKIFNKRKYSFSVFAFQIIEFLFSSAKECQCSDPSKKSGSSSLELFMIYAYCHKGFEAWDSRNWYDQYARSCPGFFWPKLRVSSILTVKQETNSHRMTELQGSVSTGNGRSFSRKPSFREVIASF